MLRVTQRFLVLMPSLRGLFEQIARHDIDLARQGRRASCSVALNQAEGWASQKGNRRARFSNAFASLKETQMTLQLAVAMGYIAPLTHEIADGLDHVAAQSWLLMHPKRT